MTAPLPAPTSEPAFVARTATVTDSPVGYPPGKSISIVPSAIPEL